jgi:hypothetical protein
MRKFIQHHLQYILLELGRLRVIDRGAEIAVQSDLHVNRAMDVLTAALTYIALTSDVALHVQVNRHEQTVRPSWDGGQSSRDIALTK